MKNMESTEYMKSGVNTIYNTSYHRANGSPSLSDITPILVDETITDMTKPGNV